MTTKSYVAVGNYAVTSVIVVSKADTFYRLVLLIVLLGKNENEKGKDTFLLENYSKTINQKIWGGNKNRRVFLLL